MEKDPSSLPLLRMTGRGNVILDASPIVILSAAKDPLPSPKQPSAERSFVAGAPQDDRGGKTPACAPPSPSPRALPPAVISSTRPRHPERSRPHHPRRPPHCHPERSEGSSSPDKTAHGGKRSFVAGAPQDDREGKCHPGRSRALSCGRPLLSPLSGAARRVSAVPRRTLPRARRGRTPPWTPLRPAPADWAASGPAWR